MLVWEAPKTSARGIERDIIDLDGWVGPEKLPTKSLALQILDEELPDLVELALANLRRVLLSDTSKAQAKLQASSLVLDLLRYSESKRD